MTSSTLLSDLSAEDRDTLRGAWKFWGMDMQMTIFEEELSELGEALTLAHIDGWHWSEKVWEELADVLVCFAQVEDCLRHFPIEGFSGLWMDVEKHAAELKAQTESPDSLLVLHSFRVVKAFAKTRRHNDGELRWNHDLISELGGLLAAIQRTERYLKGTVCLQPRPHWVEVMQWRAAKLARLGMRLDEVRKAAEEEEE